MKLLHRVRLFSPPARPSVQVVFSCTVIAALIGLEIAGRLATSDLHDGLSALALFGIALAVSAWHKRRPLAWANWVTLRARLYWKRLAEWKYDHGIDFRGTPPLPSKIPLAAWGLGIGLVAWGIAAVCVWYLLPGGWREIGVRTSYVAYLLVLIALWTGLLAGLLAGLFAPVLLFDRWLREMVSDSHRRSITFISSLAYLFAVTIAVAFLPAVGGLAVCFAAAVIAGAWCCRRSSSDLAVLWRAGPNGGVFSVPLPRLIAGGVLFIVLAFIDLIITGSSGRILTHIEATDAMPLTGSLATFVAWTAPGLLFILGTRMWRNSRANPSGSLPQTVYLRSELPLELRDQATALIRSWGWNCRKGNKPAQRGDVKIELVNPENSQATEFEPRWPLALSLDDLKLDNVKDRLARRDEIQLRRRFFSGLHTLFKEARLERKSRGGGYWFAPHWWFIDGLGREESGRSRKTEDNAGVLRQVGPSLSKLFGARVRQHWYRILRAAHIDVIYIEDGINAKKVERVLRMLLEVHDMHGGKKPVDDHTFRGIPKVRVVVHDFSPEKSPSAMPEGYKQPKYDELSRGRVLHIFRDKGDSEELIDNPFDFDSIPSPMLSV
jgi:hypothetical protein